MYKYLSIAENLKEMMLMLKSLPACTLVFDKRSNLVDLNKPALQLLRINNAQEFNAKRDEVFPTNDYIKTIIKELKKGNTVRHAKTLLKYANDGHTVVELCACMVNGLQELFVFQLFEISFSTNSDLGSFTSYADRNDMEDIAFHPVNWVTSSKKTFVLTNKNKPKERRSERLVENNSMQLGKTKYRKLTNIEETVAKLAALNMSVLQIANATNKTTLSIRVIMRRVTEKEKLNIRKGLSPELNEYAHTSSIDKTN
jgi:hypothetical protein